MNVKNKEKYNINRNNTNKPKLRKQELVENLIISHVKGIKKTSGNKQKKTSCFYNLNGHKAKGHSQTYSKVKRMRIYTLVKCFPKKIFKR